MPNFEDVIRGVSIAIQARVPVLLEGIPGDAKTSIVNSLFRRVCDRSHTSIVALHEPTEYGGFPLPTKDERERDIVALMPTAWARNLADVNGQKLAGLFLDELSNGAPATRSAAMRGILDGVWGDTKIPNLTTVAAMNPVEQSESGYELSAPLANRFCHVDWEVPVSWWADQLIAGFPDPDLKRLDVDLWKQHTVWATTLVAAFAKAKPSAVRNIPKERSRQAKPWPSLRSFTMARDLLAADRACGYTVDHDITLMHVAGCVGEAAATEFLAYGNELDLPDPEEVLKNPRKLRLPDRGDRAYAVLTSVTAAVLANNTVDRWRAGWAVLGQAVKADRVDVAAGAAKALAAERNRPKGYGKAPDEVAAFIPVLKQAGYLP